jgi:2-dehydropantoate 2-reductase
MRIAVLGCGAIGSLFLGYLKEKGFSPKAICKSYQKPFLEKELTIEGARGLYQIKNLEVNTSLKEAVDLAILSTKMDSLEEVVKDNKDFLKNAFILTTQNGIGVEDILSNYFSKEKIITGIVMFGATFYPPNKVIHNFEGELVLGSFFKKEIEKLNGIKEILEKVFKVYVLKNIKRAKYLKVFINLNNAIAACLGISMQEAFSNLKVSTLAIRLLKEAYYVVKNSNIELEDLPSYPKERIEKLVNMPQEKGAKIFSQIMCSLSKEPLYGSILQSIKRGKKSEIDYINGAIVKLAEENKLEAPLNKKIVEMVHRVERENRFYSVEDFLKEVG